jgi:hypothetical protein
MRLRIIGGLDTQLTGLTPRGAKFSPAEPIEANHSLVQVTPVIAASDAPETFRQAAFLAQLLATRDHHPQTRERRRAEPREALAAYRAAAALTGR